MIACGKFATATSLDNCSGNYFLQNYNLEQSALVIAVVGNLETMFTTFGNRGLRVLNGAVGMAAQRAYLAAASLSIGCGAILGFSNRALNGILALEGSDETALLLLLVGHQVSDSRLLTSG